MSLEEDAEVLDLVDAADRVMGQIRRGEFYAAKTPPGFIRVSEAFIINSKGQLWIPRRTADKTVAPNGLDYSAAEHVQSGETYMQAMIRGFAEELSLDVSASELELRHMFPGMADSSYFRAVYAYHSDDVPAYNPADFTEYLWLTPAQTLQRIAAGDTAKSYLAPTVQRVFLRST